MQTTDERKERAAYVNLPQFLISHGFDLKKVGKEYVWKEHDSLHIKDNGPGERGVWHQFSTGAGGDNIGFLREFMRMSFNEAVEALTGEHIERIDMPSHTYQPRQETQKAGEFTLLEADNARRVFAFLCRTRGLDYELVASLVRQGVISQEEKTGNVLFKYYDAHGKVIGAEKVGTSTEHKFKGVAAGSAGGHGFEVVRGAGEKAYFFESAIDMLSYLEMYDKELTNCRLISMMGVKPNIVIDTMLRNNIPSEHVFLCSDNDTAGNDFAQRLQAKYPEMKRVVTPDIYKDWNDMLRGIPKVVEHKTDKIKEAHNMTDLITYGNRMWNDATDNRDKSLISMHLSDFQRVRDTLESSGINYYAYEMNGTVRMAVNDKDSDWLRSILGNVNITKSSRTYSPPEKNVFGSTEYRYIPQKEYFSDDRDLILKMAEIMAQRGMQFSGRIYPTGKGTLTVSHTDLFSVRNIRDEVVNMRKQFASHDMGEKVGSRDYRSNRDTHYHMSRLTPEQFQEVKPFIETNVNYHAVARDGKIAFAVDKENAAVFHRALENAVREINMLRSMADIGLTMEQNVALSPVIHRLAVENISLELADFFDNRYDDAQFGEMISLVNAYLDQPVYERYGEHSKLSEMLDAKNSFDRSIELSDFFAQHEFSHEQKSAITAMFVGDVTRAQIDVIDETFTAEEIQQFGEILHTAMDENAVADFLANRTKPELTEMEQAFLESAIEPVMAKSVLAWDEIEDLGYIFFEEGYIDKYSASDRAMYGNGVYEKDIYEIADRMRHGENIHADLTRALLGNQQTFTTKNDHTFHVTYNKEDITATFGNAERSVSYDAVGEAFLSLFENEYKDILKAREEEKRKEAEMSEPVEEKQDYVAFSWGKDPEWFTESEILHDFAKQHPTVSLALANAVFEYLDEKQHAVTACTG